MHEPINCDGEVVEDDHPSVILTGETVKRFSFFIIIIVGLGIVIAGVVTIGTITIRTTITGSIVLLIITDFFNECTRGMMSRGGAFLSREASKL